MKKLFLSVIIAALCLITGASASTISTSAYPSDFFVGSTQLTLQGATIYSYGDDIAVNLFGNSNSFCAISYTIYGNTCTADMSVYFSSAVHNLSFDVYGWGEGDYARLSIIGEHGSLSGILDITHNIIGLDLSTFGNIAGLYFRDMGSTNAGFGYKNFNFSQLHAVPIPAAVNLLAAGLAFLFLSFRRKYSPQSRLREH